MNAFDLININILKINNGMKNSKLIKLKIRDYQRGASLFSAFFFQFTFLKMYMNRCLILSSKS